MKKLISLLALIAFLASAQSQIFAAKTPEQIEEEEKEEETEKEKEAAAGKSCPQ